MADLTKNRLFYLDYLRAFMVILVVFEHALLPYSPLFKNTAFIADFEGHTVFDIFHLHNDAIMMPLLFLIAGFFFMTSLQTYPRHILAVKKFWRWVTPFVLGIVFLVPIQTYFRDLIMMDESLMYFDYVKNIYFFDKIQSSGFWFLYYLTVLASTFIVVDWFFPHFKTKLATLCQFMVKSPITAFLILILISALILAISDFLYGPLWWTGYAKLFYIRGSRFIIKMIFFLMGIGLAQLNQSVLIERLHKRFGYATLLALISFSLYATYCITNFYEGAYNIEVLRAIRMQESWSDLMTTIINYGGPTVIRTTLMGLTMWSLTLFYMSSFARFFNRPIPWMQALAVSSFGIYIFHEPIQVFMTYQFYDQDYSVVFKFITVLTVSLAGAWIVTQLLRATSFFKKIL